MKNSSSQNTEIFHFKHFSFLFDGRWAWAGQVENDERRSSRMLLYFLFCLLSCEHVEYFSWLGCVGSTAGRAVTLGWPSSMIGVGSLPPYLLLGRRTCVRLDAERVHIDKLSVRAANQPVSLCAMLRESQKRKEYNNIYPKEEEKKSINRGRRRP
jgi:hypothetical protein